jgi:hypothetical protein
MSTTTASPVVAAAEQAVIDADKGVTPQSAEVAAEETAKGKGSKAKVPESSEVAAAAATPKKYSPELKAAAKRAEELRGKARTVGPVQVQRVQNALGKTKPADVVGAFKSVKAATEFAGGSKDVEQPDMVKDISASLADPFARGRGLVAICLALREQKA